MTTITTLIEKFKNYKTTEEYKKHDMLFDEEYWYAVYEEEHGQGYVVDIEDSKEDVIIDIDCVEACYYWFEDGQLKSEPFDYSDDDQHRRHVDAGQHLIYEGSYFIPFEK